MLAVAHFCLQLLVAAAEDPVHDPEQPQEAAKAGDRYQLPAGGAEELIRFVLRLRGEETADADYAKKLAAIVAAGWSLHNQADEADRELDGYDRAMGTWLYVAVNDARSEEDAQQAHSGGRGLCATSGFSRGQRAMMVMIEWYAKDPDRITNVCHGFTQGLAASKYPQAASHARKLEGTGGAGSRCWDRPSGFAVRRWTARHSTPRNGAARSCWSTSGPLGAGLV